MIIIGFLKKEFSEALRDIRMCLLIFVLPVLQLIIFGLALSTETKNVKLAIIHNPNDFFARRIFEATLSSSYFIVESIQNKNPEKLITSKKAEAVMILPSKRLLTQIERNNAKIQILIDATNALRAQTIENYLKNIISNALKNELGLKSELPFRFNLRVLFNPSLSTSVFLVPAVLSMILCILTTILTAMSLAREKETGTFETLIVSPLSTLEILIGKTLPYIIIGLIDVPVVLIVAIFGFNVPLRGSSIILFIASFFFIIATASVGILISTIAKTQQQAMMAGFLFIFPAVLFSGIVFPIENMPLIFKWIPYLDPIQYFVSLLRNIMLKGGDYKLVITNITFLFAIAIIGIILSYKRFKHSFN